MFVRNPRHLFATVAVALAGIAVLPCTTPASAQAPAPPMNVRIIPGDEPAANPGVVISPVMLSLAAGSTQRFTAAVSGTANKSVTWTATGGSITSDGTYTAGS